MKKINKNIFSNEIVIIPLLGLILILVLTWPLLLHISTYFQSGGDYVFEAWELWYNQYSFITGRILNQVNYFNSPQFYPLPYTYAYSDTLILPSILFAPLNLLFQNISLSMNITSIFTFVLTFCTSYYVIKKITKSVYASIIGSFIFTFNPTTFAHFEVGHINLLSKFFIPLTFYFGYKFISEINWKNTLLFFLFFTLNSLTSVNFEIFSLICLPFLFIPFLIFQIYKMNIIYFKNLFLKSLSFIFFIPILLYFNLPYLQFSAKEGVIRNLSVTDYFSARPIDFIASLPTNILYGTIIRYWDSFKTPLITGGLAFYTPHSLGINITPTILFLIGIYYIFRKNIWKNRVSLFMGLILVFFISFILMFGPFLEGIPDFTVKLPYYYLYTYLPFPLLQGTRTPVRFEFIWYFPFSIFAAFGAEYLIKRFKHSSIVLPCLIVFLLIIENFNIYNYLNRNNDLTMATAYQNNKNVYSILNNKIVLNYPPIDPNVYSTATNYLVWGMRFNNRIMNGYSGYLPNDLITFLNNITLSNTDLLTLKALGVQDILIHKALLKSPVSVNNSLTVYKDNNIAVLDLNKLKGDITFCDKQDLKYNLKLPTQAIYSLPVTYTLQVINNNNCFNVNKYQSRYIQTNIEINSKFHTSYLIFPIIIPPYENEVLQGSLISYNNKFYYINPGEMKGRIILKGLGIKSNFNIPVLLKNN